MEQRTVFKHVADQTIHAETGALHAAKVILLRLRQAVFTLLDDHVAETADSSQRRAHVMYHAVGEPFQCCGGLGPPLLFLEQLPLVSEKFPDFGVAPADEI